MRLQLDTLTDMDVWMGRIDWFWPDSCNAESFWPFFSCFLQRTRTDTRPGISREWSPLADFLIDLPDRHTDQRTDRCLFATNSGDSKSGILQYLFIYYYFFVEGSIFVITIINYDKLYTENFYKMYKTWVLLIWSRKEGTEYPSYKCFTNRS